MRTHLTKIAILAGVACAALPATASATGSAAALTAPVVKEKFTALPCTGAPSHRSTLEMEGCAEHRVLTSDKTINALNARVFGTLETNRARTGFIASNTHWVAYRDDFCTTSGIRYAGGTEQPVAVVTCLSALNDEHVNDLKTLLRDH